MPATPTKPIILITGASGKLGRALRSSLQDRLTIVGIDRKANATAGSEVFAADFSSADSIELALLRLWGSMATWRMSAM